MDFLFTFFTILIRVLQFALIGRVLMSWIDPTAQSQVSRIIHEITDPVILPIRRVIPSVGMFDLSTLIALLLLNVLGAAVASAAG